MECLYTLSIMKDYPSRVFKKLIKAAIPNVTKNEMTEAKRDISELNITYYYPDTLPKNPYFIVERINSNALTNYKIKIEKMNEIFVESVEKIIASDDPTGTML